MVSEPIPSFQPVVVGAALTTINSFTDDPSNRVLSGPSYCEDGTGSEGLTQEKCIEWCDQRGYCEYTRASQH